VSITLLALLAFALSGIRVQFTNGETNHYSPFFQGEGAGGVTSNLFHACALMFVAYTGYGRIATLAEEVTNPKQTIPRAIIATLVASALIYIGVRW
jgi:basic amino acid/polyamine antiporter, APA family